MDGSSSLMYGVEKYFEVYQDRVVLLVIFIISVRIGRGIIV